MTFFKDLEQLVVKFLWNQKRPQIAKELLKRKNKAGGITMPDFELYYKGSMVLGEKQTHRPMEQNIEHRNGPSALWATNL